MKIIAIRGGNGSGKTFVARQVMSYFKDQFVGEKLTPSGIKYQDFLTFGVVGSYARACGGADTIEYKENPIVAQELTSMGLHVLTEGCMFGVVFQPILDMMKTMPQNQYVPVCLDTEYDTCVSQINSRRAAEGKTPLEKLTNIEISYKKHLSSAKKLHAAGLNPYWVSPEAAVDVIIRELKSA